MGKKCWCWIVPVGMQRRTKQNQKRRLRLRSSFKTFSILIHQLHRQNLFFQLKHLRGPCVGSNTIVMMEWERPYMEACVDALKISPSDSVLEIGFGYSLFVCSSFFGGFGILILPWPKLAQPNARCAYSANRIQSFRPKVHCIIECSAPVLKKLHQWKEKKDGIVVVEGTWQTKVCDVVNHKRCPYPRNELMLHFM